MKMMSHTLSTHNTFSQNKQILVNIGSVRYKLTNVREIQIILITLYSDVWSIFIIIKIISIISHTNKFDTRCELFEHFLSTIVIINQ